MTDAVDTAVYRLYDVADQLLYIGVAVHPLARLSQHGRRDWADCVARITIEWHPTRTAALDAERAAIIAERPRHNIVHNQRRDLFASRRWAECQQQGVPHLVADDIGFHADLSPLQHGWRWDDLPLGHLVPLLMEAAVRHARMVGITDDISYSGDPTGDLAYVAPCAPGDAAMLVIALLGIYHQEREPADALLDAWGAER